MSAPSLDATAPQPDPRDVEIERLRLGLRAIRLGADGSVRLLGARATVRASIIATMTRNLLEGREAAHGL